MVYVIRAAPVLGGEALTPHRLLSMLKDLLPRFTARKDKVHKARKPTGRARVGVQACVGVWRRTRRV